ncbi:tyrosine-type recombinase/integrase [Metamycoplasma hyosynoviae]|uniref:Tyrosine-type recombinase/integrase n=1 Tax=Metamycoplasma hyosynoviae TaxID=29559 RepID=A0A9Q9BV72_9BACT|nr:tyrosine-type recombinase/integrase [Metamycoplasma hyosynoviae]MDD1358532.1 tyrosine-type recombinase/integrase [Metamycoplasma hyosynoviae]MDD1361281.1 tyrosine-type recombinase/integrase [Metamycoplasma hyosynoviae]MDD7847508.1 tyrosine-type recombinase/integrase [Metamycoplasma hyosynoviae]UTO25748.1 tyrosine-type recombinase/integrase [Metamycoplasma hyosynoviae]UTO26839.1 tyrosine-type recombinase/integrase [Metamycoplasma hyosynoviae]
MKNIDQLKIFYAEFERLIETNNRSSVTLNCYKKILNRLQNWKTIDELLKQINYILNHSGVSQNSLFYYRAVFKVFCEWFSKRNHIFIPFNERINKYKIERGTRRAYTKEELEILFAELKAFDNPKFEVIFKILLTTGLRVGEWDYIDWDKLKNSNWNGIIIRTAKNNNPRPFKILLEDSEHFKEIQEAIKNDLDIKIKAKTIKNLFAIFKNFVLKRNPNFKAKISAHILRHTFVTISAEDNTIEEISKILGHTNSNTTCSTYLTYNSILANKKLNKMQQNISNFFNDEIVENHEIALKEENQKLKNEIEILKEELQNLHSSIPFNFEIKEFKEHN